MATLKMLRIGNWARILVQRLHRTLYLQQSSMPKKTSNYLKYRGGYGIKKILCVHGHTLHNLGMLKGNWASPHTGMILIEIMTSYPLIMKTLAQAFICLSHATLYKLVQLVVRLEEVATRLYKVCNKIVGLESGSGSYILGVQPEYSGE